MATAKQLVDIAVSQIGYHEKNSDANLDSFTASNDGNGNHTKYARDLRAAGYYNGDKCGYDWCDVFVDWCFYQVAGKDAKKAQDMECQTGDCGAGCWFSAQYYRNQNRFYNTPEVGDQIFFGKPGSENHTGIVETVSSTKITTIEGNTSNKVDRKTYNKNDSSIVGYGRPKYSEYKKEELKMSNSPLVCYTKISPNKTPNRNHIIDTITIHCVVGQMNVEPLGEWFALSSTKASSNYGIGKDGRIGMYVEEKDRSWCSSNAANDNRAVTIEVASDTTHPFAVTDKAYASLIDLVTDICKRNNIKKLVWSTNKNDRVNHLNGCNMTVHRDYCSKSCPGEYLYSRHGDIAAKVNARLNKVDPTPDEKAVNYDGIVTASVLNCRSEANSNCKIVTTYTRDTKVHISKESNGWGFTGDGWVSLEYIKKVDTPTPQPTPDPKPEPPTPTPDPKDDDNMTQEKFNEFMANWLAEQAKRAPGKWSEEDRTWAEENGIIKGDADGSKMYKKFVTREEMTAIAHRLAELK